MKNTNVIILSIIATLALFALPQVTLGQEHIGHIDNNPALFNKNAPQLPLYRTTAANPLELPFFEDFTTYSVYPDSNKWSDYQVYVNNTMGNNPISRGVATFDALDWHGIPYDSFSNVNVRYADSLTCRPINLSLNVVTPADSIYLSFFYQPQGNGYFPISQDSLMLYFRTKFGGFVKVWSAQGTTLEPFKQIMIPIRDSLYFDSSFRFRFVNKAALYWSDAIWNVDYIRLDKNRSQSDTTVNDIGFSSDPSFLLNDYTSLPYRQFYSFAAGETAAQYTCSLRNNNTIARPISYGYTAVGVNTGATLKPHAFLSGTADPGESELTFPSYTSVIPFSAIGNYGKAVFENKFYIESVSTSDPADNDTVTKYQVFDNYLAYDDGSAEKSYYLTLYPTLPGRVSVEYHLNKQDTMRGMAIYFGRQIPFAYYKYFNIEIYSALKGVNGAPSDILLYEEESLQPGYVDSINHFWVYKFTNPVILPAGTFFAGTFQPAQSGSDSLYFGLDVNRIGNNHIYYKVLSDWNPSLFSGAVMMRPLFGKDIVATSVTNLNESNTLWSVSPNPALNTLQIHHNSGKNLEFIIRNVQGQVVVKGQATDNQVVNIEDLPPGMYFIKLMGDHKLYATQKFVKTN